MVSSIHPLVLYGATRQVLHAVLIRLHPPMSLPENWRMTYRSKQSRFVVKESESRLPKSQQQQPSKWLRKKTSILW
jgi:hypothetical protein